MSKEPTIVIELTGFFAVFMGFMSGLVIGALLGMMG